MIYSLFYSTLTRSILFFINFIAIKNLAPSEYGALSYILNYITTIATASAFGGNVSINTTITKHQTDRPDLINNFIRSHLILSLILALPFAALTSPLLKLPTDHSYLDTFSIATIYAIVFTLTLNTIAEGGLHGARKYKSLALNATITTTLTIPIIPSLIHAHGLNGALYSALTARLASLLLNYRSFYQTKLFDLKPRPKNIFSKETRAILTKLSLPMLLGGLMVTPIITIATRTVSLQENGLSEVGYFSWVYQIYLIAIFVPGSLTNYYISQFSSKNNNKQSLKSTLILNLIFSALLTATLFTFKQNLLTLGGESYAENSNAIFNIMIPTIILYSLNTAFSSYWPANGYGWFGFALNFIWAASFLTTTFLLSDDLGGQSLAYAFFCSYLLLFLIQISSLIKITNQNRRANYDRH